jgi:hypothetical protein
MAYRARNQAEVWILAQLGAMEDIYLDEARKAIATGQYDSEWQKQDGPGPKLQKLLDSLRERWEKQYAIRLLHGDFYTLIPDVGDDSIDAIITDPPYNISTERVYRLEGRTDIVKDFGDWDHATDEAFGRTWRTGRRPIFAS